MKLHCAILAVAVAGCSSTEGTVADLSTDSQTDNDATTDATDATDASLFNLPPGDDGHSELGAALSAGQTRAGRVTASDQLLAGIKVEGRIGDLKIYNERVGFIIAGARDTDGFSPHGGEVLDAARFGADGGDSLIGETILTVGTATMGPESVGVISDGSDGKAAVVRVIGTPKAFPWIDALIPLSSKAQELQLAIDYSLEPDSDALQIELRMFNGQQRDIDALMVLALLAGDGVRFFGPGAGFDTDEIGRSTALGAVGDQISYAFVGEDKLQPLVLERGIWIISGGKSTVPAGGEVSRKLQLVVGPGTPEGLQRTLRGLRREPEPTKVTGVVRDESGEPVPGANVHVLTSDESYATMARSDASGAFSMALDPGDYALTAVANSTQATRSLTVADAPITADIELPQTATLELSVTDDSGTAIPAKLRLSPDQPPQSFPASFGEPRQTGLIFHTGATSSVKLPAGSYSLVASRGFEYEIDTRKVELVAGEQTALQLELEHVVDTTGYMSGDFHLHGMRSMDSDDRYELKVAAIVAAGVELPVATDHEYIADINPTIAKLGLQKWTYGIVGEELTTALFGHFNPFPIEADPTAPNRGAVQWWDKTVPEIFAQVHALWPSAVLQVNHPRSSSAGYLKYIGYDPATGEATRTVHWSGAFDALEAFNDSSFSQNSDTVQDWFSMLDRGLLVTATGNSDSHNVLTQPVGYPRNYVKLSTETPANVDLDEFATSVKKGRLVVSGGAFISVSAGSKSLGDVVDATSGNVTLAIKVQAPTWVDLDALKIFGVGGEQLASRTLDSSTADPTNPVVRFDDTIELTVSKDSWIVVVAEGSNPLDPVVPGSMPFAVANPLYLDADGNGSYDAPLDF